MTALAYRLPALQDRTAEFLAAIVKGRNMKKDVKFDLKSVLGQKKSITLQIQEIEQSMGEDWLLEFSAQAQEVGARIDPHQTDPSLISVTRL